MATIAPKRMAKVVVLIPPPVDPGDAPMKIRMTMKNWVACRSAFTSRVLAPAERGVTA
ncbi:hypothetical protein D3C87_2053600 [compost metagenome]